VLIYEFQLSNSVQEEYKTKKVILGKKFLNNLMSNNTLYEMILFFLNLNILPHDFDLIYKKLLGFARRQLL